LFDSNGLPLAVSNATAIPASTSALMIAGSDGTNSRYLAVDSSGRLINVGAGTAGTPAGGVLSIQGVSGGTAISITGASIATDKAAMTAGTQAGNPILGQSSGVGRIAKVDRLSYLNSSYKTLLAMDKIQGTTINTYLWTQSSLTMTNAQANGVLILNSSAITTINTYSILSSNKVFSFFNEAITTCNFRANVNTVTNGTIELGFGLPTITPGIINTGAFFRINGANQVSVVNSFNGTENTSAALATLSTTSYYEFIVTIEDNGSRFIIEDANGIPVVDTFLKYTLTTPSSTVNNYINAFSRVYNGASAPASAPQIKISGFYTWQYDIGVNKPWSEQLASFGRSAYVNPSTFLQTMQLSTSAPTTSTPTNISSAYTGLGGEFSLNATASSENLLGIFTYAVPAGFTLHITEIYMPLPFVTTALGATVSIHEYCLILANQTTGVPSTATGQKIALGAFTAAASAAAGTVFNGQPISMSFKTPLIIQSGNSLLITVKVISGVATGVYRGSIFINGYWE
jgi:hypothetical protein